MKLPRLLIVVPVFNEEPNVLALLEAFGYILRQFQARYSLSFILVDDGSTDNTVGLAKSSARDLDLIVLEHESNRGPGAAFATAFTYLSELISSEDLVITMEGDNTSRTELIEQMMTRTCEGFDVVLASPYMYGGGFTQTSLWRKFLSSGANLVVKDLLDIQGILTVSSFFRLYKGEAIRSLQATFGPGIVERTGFESMVEMVMKMAMLRLRISEVAMRLDSSRRKGKSKMKVFRTIRGYLSLWSQKARWQNQLALSAER